MILLAGAIALATVAAGAPAPPSPTDEAAVGDESTQELFERARAKFSKRDLVGAEDLYKQVLVRDSNHVKAMLELASVYEASGKLDYAKALLTRASALVPQDEHIAERLRKVDEKLLRSLAADIERLMKDGQYELALPKISMLMGMSPDDAELHFMKAQCHLELGRREAAIDEIDKALKLRDDPRYRKFRDEARAPTADGELGSLVVAAEREMESDSPEARTRAMELVRRVLKLDPDNSWAENALASLTREGGLGDDAKQHLKNVGHRLRNLAASSWGATVQISTILNEHVEVLVILLVALLVLVSPLTSMLVRGITPHHSLAGQLSHYSIHELLSFVNAHQQTGMLKIKSSRVKGKIYMDKGEIYHATCRRMEGHNALQHLFEQADDGYFIFFESTATTAVTIDSPLSLILMDFPERHGVTTAKTILQRRSKMTSLLDSRSDS